VDGMCFIIARKGLKLHTEYASKYELEWKYYNYAAFQKRIIIFKETA
jgi:hypothetical protein